MRIWKYILKRILISIPLFFLITIILFYSVYLMGDPIELLLAQQPRGTLEIIKHLKEYYHLDRPIWQQYLYWLWDLFHFNLGYSFIAAAPVNKIIGNLFFLTIELQLLVFMFSIVTAIFLGVFASSNRQSKTDLLITTFMLSGRSIPTILWGPLLMLFFAFYIPIFPSFGAFSIRKPIYDNLILDHLWHLVLPFLTLYWHHTVTFFRLVKNGLLEMFNSDLILSLKSCGLSKKSITYRHALRNSLIPLITESGLVFGGMIAGSPLVETIFGWPGLGYLFVKSLHCLDFPTIMGISVILTIMVITVNLIADIAYCLVDPRIRLGE